MSLKKFGDLVVGDVILGPDGQEVTVVEAYPEHMPETMYEIETESGEILKASGNHLWYVETSFDYSYHRERKRVGRRLFGKLSKEIMENLESIATSEEDIETGLADMVALCEIDFNDSASISVLDRIASSIGHVAETSAGLTDYISGETLEIEAEPVRSYDAKVFTQQILAITGQRKYRKKWKVIVGRVITTEQMIDFEDDIEIPTFVENRG